MFWNQFGEKEIGDTCHKSIIENIEKLEAGDSSCLYLVYYVFAQDDKTLIRRGAKAIKLLLKSYSMQQMLRLSESFRQYTSMDWMIDWRRIDLEKWKRYLETEEDYVCALILGSFHPNGYFRDKCVLAMGNYHNTLPYLILRMNDWVAVIRDHAACQVREKLQTCSVKEMVMASWALEKIKNSGRREYEDLIEIEKSFMGRIEKHLTDLPFEEIASYEFKIREAVYKLLFAKKLLQIEEAEFLLDRERHSFCQSIIISGILRHYHCPIETIDSYFSHKSFIVRKIALEYKFRVIKNKWQGLEEMLLDSNRSIRDLTVYILEKYSEINIADFYIRHLGDENPVIPILGLGENGKEGMADLLMPFLKWDCERVVKSTLLAISKLCKADKEELYWKFLMDQRTAVSKAAYLAARNNRISYGAYKLYSQFQISQEKHVRRHLVLLLLQENSWERLPYLISLWQDERVSDLQDKILGHIKKRSLYAKISGKQAETVCRALSEQGKTLPDYLVKEIRFDLKFVTI